MTLAERATQLVTVARMQIAAISHDKAPAHEEGFNKRPAEEVTGEALGRILSGRVEGMRVELGLRGAIESEGDGGLTLPLAFEFEGRAHDSWRQQLWAALLRSDGGSEVRERLDQSWVEDTPSGGRRWFFRYHANDQRSFAHMWRGLVAREARGAVGGEVKVFAELLDQSAIVAPSGGRTHPTGKVWQTVSGGPEAIQELRARDIELLAEAMHEVGIESPGGRGRRVRLSDYTQYARDVERHYDRIATTESSLELLLGSGWTVTKGELPDRVRLARPGGDGQAVLGGEAPDEAKHWGSGVYVFTAHDPILAEGYHSPFTLYAELKHGTDVQSAAAELGAELDVRVIPPILTATELRTIDFSTMDTSAAISRLVRIAVQAKQESGAPLLLRQETVSGEPVGVISPGPDASSVRRWDPRSAERLITAISTPIRTSKKGVEYTHRVPPSVARGVFDELFHERSLPGVTTIASGPVLTKSGRVIEEPGYHAADRVLVSIPMERRPAWQGGYSVPSRPTRQHAQAAADLIFSELIPDFPFETDGDKARALSLIATGASRHLVPTVPAFLLDASERGTGKTLLARVARYVANGSTVATSVGAGHSDDAETEKRLVSAMLAGIGWVHVDELGRGGTISSRVLTEMVTADAGEMTGRLLGANQNIAISGLTLTFAGNNSVLEGDFNRRTIPIRQTVTKGAAAERREFRHNPLMPWVKENRPKLLAAVHTLLAHGIQNPRPHETLSGFEEWSAMVLSALSHVRLGERRCDELVMDGRVEWSDANDPEAEQWGSLLAWIHEHFGTTRAPIRDLREKLPKHVELPDALRYAEQNGDSVQRINRNWSAALKTMRGTSVPDGRHIYRLRTTEGRGKAPATYSVERETREASHLTAVEVPQDVAPHASVVRPPIQPLSWPLDASLVEVELA